MIEPIFTARNQAALELHDTPEAARDAALVHRATALAIESAFSYNIDFPCGAVAAVGNMITGRSLASDTRNGYRQMHAEYMAVMDSLLLQDMRGIDPDTVAVSLEPCGQCQDYLATIKGLKRVVFGLGRKAASDRGLVNPKDETIFERAKRVGLQYKIVQIEDPQLQRAGEILLDCTARDLETGAVDVDTERLSADLTRFMAE